MELSYPKVKKRADGNFFIEFTLGSKRMRLVNGQKIKFNLQPNLYKSPNYLLKRSIYLINNNYTFDQDSLELYDLLVKNKLNEPLSDKYKRGIESIANLFREQVKILLDSQIIIFQSTGILQVLIYNKCFFLFQNDFKK